MSELIPKARDPAVANWVAGMPLDDLFFSAAGEAELRYGAMLLAPGRLQIPTYLTDIKGCCARL